ncbi:hypothetical protein [Streptomyces sp. NPDC059165]|uniref:hypothetical protein n=1 Tax=Streptomyces sp. NPDC059165 TaxID=3346751 RepID=UPI003691543B
MIVALAVIGGGVSFLMGSGGNADVADSTKGYNLTPAASVGEFTKQKDDNKSLSSKD